jgi:hypothetical protein
MKRADPEASEEVIMYRTMIDLIKPKLVYLDLPLFMALLSDLFPGVELPTTDGGALKRAIETELRENNLQVSGPRALQRRCCYTMLSDMHHRFMKLDALVLPAAPVSRQGPCEVLLLPLLPPTSACCSCCHLLLQLLPLLHSTAQHPDSHTRLAAHQASI